MISLFRIGLLVLPSLLLSGESTQCIPLCLMKLFAETYTLPDSGFTGLTSTSTPITCDHIPAHEWVVGRVGINKLYLNAKGPSGSGRHWIITIGISDSTALLPYRGICISISTIGWRTLQRYSKGALPWLEDIDKDGDSEVVLWDSFPIHPNASMVRYGLFAWVYRLVSNDLLTIDMQLTRENAQALAREYRDSTNVNKMYYWKRAQIAEYIESFAEGKCSLCCTESCNE